MPKGCNPIDEARRHVAVLKAIVGAERSRALSKPRDGRNFDLGFLDSDKEWTHDEAAREIAKIFTSLELLLDHFNIAHMAASFEHASQACIGNALGTARSTLEKKPRQVERWLVRLLREAKSFQSLDSIGDLLGLTGDDKASFEAIRKVRNELDHGVPIKDVPSIADEDARVALTEALERLKG